MRKLLKGMVGFLIVVVLACLLLPACQTVIWDGGYDLKVSFKVTEGTFHSVTCRACSRLEEAQWEAEYGPETTSGWTAAKPFDGQSLIVNVQTSGRDSFFGLRSTRYQHRFLAVIAEKTD